MAVSCRLSYHKTIMAPAKCVFSGYTYGSENPVEIYRAPILLMFMVNHGNAWCLFHRLATISPFVMGTN